MGEDKKVSFRPRDPECTNHVQLVISSFLNIGGVGIGYHTSVAVNGKEYFFDICGICGCDGICSHGKASKTVIDCGFSPKSGDELVFVLMPHFLRGTYDLLFKNCNSFTDVALHFLLGIRLDESYSAVEKRLGQKPALNLVRMLTNGTYEPNVSAVNFTADSVIAELIYAERCKCQ